MIMSDQKTLKSADLNGTIEMQYLIVTHPKTPVAHRVAGFLVNK
jgi:hypothetical protein